MEKIECASCGKHLRRGGLKYLVTIYIAADFDGVITEEASEEELQRVLVEAEARREEDLENEVYQEMALILCKPCRDAFVRKPMGSMQGGTLGSIH